MQTTAVRSGIAALAVLSTVSLVSPALAEVIAYKATLTASSEVPATESKGTGNLTASYDTATKALTYTLEFSGLTGPATAAHFHGPAAPGVNAAPVVPIGVAPNLASPAKGTATLSDAQAADLTSGNWYVNVHTNANKGGEIRGQLVPGK